MVTGPAPGTVPITTGVNEPEKLTRFVPMTAKALPLYKTGKNPLPSPAGADPSFFRPYHSFKAKV
jgi:hypothetical protein